MSTHQSSTKNIFVFGDSITKGVVTIPVDGHESLKYAVNPEGIIRSSFHSGGNAMRNLSRTGSTVKQGLDKINRHLSQIQQGDTIVMEFGGNDCNFDWSAVAANPDAEHTPIVPLAQFSELYSQAVSALLSVGAKPILLSLPALLPQRFFDYVSRNLNRDNILRWLGGDVCFISNWHEKYNLEIFKLGSQLNVPVIDITSVLLERRNLGDYYCPDGMHPNASGQAIIAEVVAQSGLLDI